MTVSRVRCPSCGEIVDVGPANCPRCGSALGTVVVKREGPSFTERYRGTVYSSQQPGASLEPLPAPPPGRRSLANPLVLIGAAILLVAAFAGAFVVLLQKPEATPVSQPTTRYAVPVKPTDTPAPTLPPGIEATVARLNDPGFCGHVKLATTVRFQNLYTQNRQLAVKLDVVAAKGDTMGTRTEEGVETGFRYVGKEYFITDGKHWYIQAEMPPYVELMPLFRVTSPSMLTYIGEETRDGQAVHHLRTTKAWPADPSMLSAWDVGQAAYRPTENALDLWATADGVPVAATYSGKTPKPDGTGYVTEIETSYAFSDVGTCGAISRPSPISTIPPSPTPKTIVIP